LLFPHAEQHYGGKRIQELGLGASLTLKQLRRTGVNRLIQSVQQVLATPTFRDKALKFSQNLRNMDSATRAANAIEETFP